MRYLRPKRARVKSFKFMFAEPTQEKYDYMTRYSWWEATNYRGWRSGRWIRNDDTTEQEEFKKQYEANELGIWSSTSTSPIRSVRAFRRRLKEWSAYLPTGLEFKLISRYVNFDVYGKTQKR